MPRIQLWGAGTPRTMRPVWMAEELGLDYELFPIGPRTGETRTAAFTALNPKQKVPLLVHGDFKLTESVAICRYLLEVAGSPAVWRPATTLERAREDEWCCYVYGELDETALYVIRRHQDLAGVYGAAPRAVESAAAYVLRHLAVVDAHLASRDWLAGPAFGLADLLLTTCLDWARYCRLPLPARVAAYRECVVARPAYLRARDANGPPPAAPR